MYRSLATTQCPCHLDSLTLLVPVSPPTVDRMAYDVCIILLDKNAARSQWTYLVYVAYHLCYLFGRVELWIASLGASVQGVNVTAIVCIPCVDMAFCVSWSLIHLIYCHNARVTYKTLLSLLGNNIRHGG